MKTLTAVPIDGPCTIQIDTGSVPDYIWHNIAQSAFIAISRAYQDPDLQAEYRQWKTERARTGGGHV